MAEATNDDLQHKRNLAMGAFLDLPSEVLCIILAADAGGSLT